MKATLAESIMIVADSGRRARARSPSAPTIKSPRSIFNESRTRDPTVPTIFLDIDGVCHPLKPSGHCLRASMDALAARADAEMDLPEHAVASTITGEFEPENMRALAACVQQCGARIVLSSTWRETAPQRRAVDAQLIAAGMPPISGYTIFGTRWRCDQILQYVHEFKLTKWVAIDDAELRLPSEHYVRVSPAVGFTDRDAECVCALLLA